MPMCDPHATIAHTTWAEIASMVRRKAETYENADDSALGAVRRIASSVVEAVTAHG